MYDNKGSLPDLPYYTRRQRPWVFHTTRPFFRDEKEWSDPIYGRKDLGRENRPTYELMCIVFHEMVETDPRMFSGSEQGPRV